MLHSDQGPDFKNEVVKQLQGVFGYKKIKPRSIVCEATLCRSVYSTLHATLSMYSNIEQNH